MNSIELNDKLISIVTSNDDVMTSLLSFYDSSLKDQKIDNVSDLFTCYANEYGFGIHRHDKTGVELHVRVNGEMMILHNFDTGRRYSLHVTYSADASKITTIGGPIVFSNGYLLLGENFYYFYTDSCRSSCSWTELKPSTIVFIKRQLNDNFLTTIDSPEIEYVAHKWLQSILRSEKVDSERLVTDLTTLLSLQYDYSDLPHIFTEQKID